MERGPSWCMNRAFPIPHHLVSTPIRSTESSRARCASASLPGSTPPANKTSPSDLAPVVKNRLAVLLLASGIGGWCTRAAKCPAIYTGRCRRGTARTGVKAGGPPLSRVGFILGLWAAQWHILGHIQPTISEGAGDLQHRHSGPEFHCAKEASSSSV